MDTAIYPFTVARKYIAAVAIPFIAILFLLSATAYVDKSYELSDFINITDNYFGVNIPAASDLSRYDQIGANGLFPIMRLGGIAKAVKFQEIRAKKIDLGIVFSTIFLGYICYAVVSGIVFDLKRGKKPGISGINLGTVFLSLLASFTVVFISLFSLKGFELVLLLNFGVFFMLSIPSVASGEPVGESFYQAYHFIKYNFRELVKLYLLCMGVAIAAPIGLLILFVFPLSVLEQSVVPMLKLILSLFGITFALFYQYVVCSRAVLDFTKKTEIRIPAFTEIVRKV